MHLRAQAVGSLAVTVVFTSGRPLPPKTTVTVFAESAREPAVAVLQADPSVAPAGSPSTLEIFSGDPLWISKVRNFTIASGLDLEGARNAVRTVRNMGWEAGHTLRAKHVVLLASAEDLTPIPGGESTCTLLTVLSAVAGHTSYAHLTLVADGVHVETKIREAMETVLWGKDWVDLTIIELPEFEGYSSAMNRALKEIPSGRIVAVLSTSVLMTQPLHEASTPCAASPKEEMRRLAAGAQVDAVGAGGTASADIFVAYDRMQHGMSATRQCPAAAAENGSLSGRPAASSDKPASVPRPECPDVDTPMAEAKPGHESSVEARLAALLLTSAPPRSTTQRRQEVHSISDAAPIPVLVFDVSTFRALGELDERFSFQGGVAEWISRAGVLETDEKGSASFDDSSNDRPIRQYRRTTAPSGSMIWVSSGTADSVRHVHRYEWTKQNIRSAHEIDGRTGGGENEILASANGPGQSSIHEGRVVLSASEAGRSRSGEVVVAIDRWDSLSSTRLEALVQLDAELFFSRLLSTKRREEESTAEMRLLTFYSEWMEREPDDVLWKEALARREKFPVVAVISVHDDVSFLTDVLKEVATVVEHIIVVASTIPWNGEVSNVSTTLVLLDRVIEDAHSSLRSKGVQLQVEVGEWKSEHEQREHGNGVARMHPRSFARVVVINADEFWHPVQLTKYMDREVECVTEGGVSDQGLDIDASVGVIHRLSYARANEGVERRMSSYSHASEEQVVDWFERKWRRRAVNSFLADLPPSTPTAFKRVVPPALFRLPPAVRVLYLDARKERHVDASERNGAEGETSPWPAPSDAPLEMGPAARAREVADERNGHDANSRQADRSDGNGSSRSLPTRHGCEETSPQDWTERPHAFCVVHALSDGTSWTGESSYARSVPDHRNAPRADDIPRDMANVGGVAADRRDPPEDVSAAEEVDGPTVKIVRPGYGELVSTEEFLLDFVISGQRNNMHRLCLQVNGGATCQYLPSSPVLVGGLRSGTHVLTVNVVSTDGTPHTLASDSSAIDVVGPGWHGEAEIKRWIASAAVLDIDTHAAPVAASEGEESRESARDASESLRIAVLSNNLEDHSQNRAFEKLCYRLPRSRYTFDWFVAQRPDTVIREALWWRLSSALVPVRAVSVPVEEGRASSILAEIREGLNETSSQSAAGEPEGTGGMHLASFVNVLRAFDIALYANSLDDPRLKILAEGVRLAKRPVRVMALCNLDPPSSLHPEAFIAPSRFAASHPSVTAFRIPTAVIYPAALDVVAYGSQGASFAAGSSEADGGIVDMPERQPSMRIGYVGRLSPERSPGLFLHAARRLVDDLTSPREEPRHSKGVASTCAIGVANGDDANASFAERIRFVIAGASRVDDHLVRLVHKLGLADHVDFLGVVEASAMPAFLRSLDAVINPRVCETFGIAVAEASAAGTPVVGFASCGVLESAYGAEVGSSNGIRGVALAAWPPSPDGLAQATLRLLRAKLVDRETMTVDSADHRRGEGSGDPGYRGADFSLQTYISRNDDFLKTLVMRKRRSLQNESGADSGPWGYSQGRPEQGLGRGRSGGTGTVVIGYSPGTAYLEHFLTRVFERVFHWAQEVKVVLDPPPSVRPLVYVVGVLDGGCGTSWGHMCQERTSALAARYRDALVVFVSGEAADVSALGQHQAAAALLSTTNPAKRPREVPAFYLPNVVTSFGERRSHAPQHLLRCTHERSAPDTADSDAAPRGSVAYLYARCDRPVRQAFFDLLVERGVTVDALGACQGERTPDLPQLRRGRLLPSWHDEAVQMYKGYRMVIAFENSDDPGYVTEKIANAYLAGAVPVYWGTDEARRIFNPESFIHCGDFDTLEGCADWVTEVARNTTLWEEYLSHTCVPSESPLQRWFSWWPADGENVSSPRDPRIPHVHNFTEYVSVVEWLARTLSTAAQDKIVRRGRHDAGQWL